MGILKDIISPVKWSIQAATYIPRKIVSAAKPEIMGKKTGVSSFAVYSAYVDKYTQILYKTLRAEGADRYMNVLPVEEAELVRSFVKHYEPAVTEGTSKLATGNSGIDVDAYNKLSEAERAKIGASMGLTADDVPTLASQTDAVLRTSFSAHLDPSSPTANNYLTTSSSLIELLYKKYSTGKIPNKSGIMTNLASSFAVGEAYVGSMAIKMCYVCGEGPSTMYVSQFRNHSRFEDRRGLLANVRTKLTQWVRLAQEESLDYIFDLDPVHTKDSGYSAARYVDYLRGPMPDNPLKVELGKGLGGIPLINVAVGFAKGNRHYFRGEVKQGSKRGGAMMAGTSFASRERVPSVMISSGAAFQPVLMKEFEQFFKEEVKNYTTARKYKKYPWSAPNEKTSNIPKTGSSVGHQGISYNYKDGKEKYDHENVPKHGGSGLTVNNIIHFFMEYETNLMNKSTSFGREMLASGNADQMIRVMFADGQFEHLVDMLSDARAQEQSDVPAWKGRKAERATYNEMVASHELAAQELEQTVLQEVGIRDDDGNLTNQEDVNQEFKKRYQNSQLADNEPASTFKEYKKQRKDEIKNLDRPSQQAVWGVSEDTKEKDIRVVTFANEAERNGVIGMYELATNATSKDKGSFDHYTYRIRGLDTTLLEPKPNQRIAKSPMISRDWGDIFKNPYPVLGRLRSTTKAAKVYNNFITDNIANKVLTAYSAVHFTLIASLVPNVIQMPLKAAKGIKNLAVSAWNMASDVVDFKNDKTETYEIDLTKATGIDTTNVTAGAALEAETFKDKALNKGEEILNESMQYIDQVLNGDRSFTEDLKGGFDSALQGTESAITQIKDGTTKKALHKRFSGLKNLIKSDTTSYQQMQDEIDRLNNKANTLTGAEKKSMEDAIESLRTTIEENTPAYRKPLDKITKEEYGEIASQAHSLKVSSKFGPGAKAAIMKWADGQFIEAHGGENFFNITLAEVKEKGLVSGLVNGVDEWFGSGSPNTFERDKDIIEGNGKTRFYNNVNLLRDASNLLRTYKEKMGVPQKELPPAEGAPATAAPSPTEPKETTKSLQDVIKKRTKEKPSPTPAPKQKDSTGTRKRSIYGSRETGNLDLERYQYDEFESWALGNKSKEALAANTSNSKPNTELEKQMDKSPLTLKQGKFYDHYYS